MEYKVSVRGDQFTFDHESILNMDWVEIDSNTFHLIKDNQSYTCEILEVNLREKTVELLLNGTKHKVEISNPLDQLIAKMGLDKISEQTQKEIKAPMPGLILEILVEKGQEVKKNDDLLILEAMKMENILKAEGDGVIKDIKVEKSQSVDKNQVLIELE